LRENANTLRPSPLHSSGPRVPRHHFVVRIELTDYQAERHISGNTKDLNLFGCYAVTVDTFPEGTKVRLRISCGETRIIAQGKVTYSRPNSGMGIAFTAIEPSSLSVLNVWLAGLRK
jgi:hypothetical protein